MDANTLRVFSFAGGSTKGYGENRFLQKFIAQWGIPQSEFVNYVDVFGGVSIGALLSCGYAFNKTPSDMESIFLNDAKRIFTIRTAAEFTSNSHNASENSNRPNILQKIALFANNDAFYNSPFSDSNYGSNILHQVLVNNFGTSKLSDLKKPIVISAVEQDMSRPVLFSNFNDPEFFIGKDFNIVDVCRASSAANPYLPSYKFNGHDYIDGAFLINNVVDRCIQLGLTIKPNVKRIVVVNVGAGIGRHGFDGSMPTTISDLAVAKVFASLTLVMVMAEQYSHNNLLYESNRLNNRYGIPLHYYGFYPKFPDDFNNEVDNSTADWFNQLATIIDANYASDSDKISNIIAKLTV